MCREPPVPGRGRRGWLGLGSWRRRKPTEGRALKGRAALGCCHHWCPCLSLRGGSGLRWAVPTGPGHPCAVGARLVPASEPAPSGPWSSHQAVLPQSLGGQSVRDGPQMAPAQWLGAAPWEAPFGADPLGPGRLDPPASSGPGRGCREGCWGARRRGRFRCSVTVTLQTHVSRKQTSLVASPSGDSASWETVRWVQGPPVRTPTAARTSQRSPFRVLGETWRAPFGAVFGVGEEAAGGDKDVSEQPPAGSGTRQSACRVVW